MENKELIRSIAEEMAAKSRPKQWEQCFREREEITAQYMEAARIAVKHRGKVINHINDLTPLMQEQFMRHDYRSMWELWQALRVAVGLSSTENKPDQEAGANGNQDKTN
jgi:hypothetical protein